MPGTSERRGRDKEQVLLLDPGDELLRDAIPELHHDGRLLVLNMTTGYGGVRKGEFWRWAAGKAGQGHKSDRIEGDSHLNSKVEDGWWALMSKTG